MKKLLSIMLTVLMVVTMVPMAVMPASAAYEYDETTKLSFEIINLVREWNGERDELNTSGSAFYDESLTKLADGEYKYTYRAALGASGGTGTWWSDTKTVTFDGVNCESDYYKTIEFTESAPVGGHTMTWTYTLQIKRYKGHTYGDCSDNGDGTHTRTCVINSAHKETASHNYAAATCSVPETCKNCGATQGEPVADAHGWNAATCVLPQTCKYCGITQGEVLGHNMVAAKFGTPAACSRCGATDINISVLEAALINTNVNLPSKAVKDDNAGYNDITWSVVDAGSTGATINGNTLKASYSGEAVIRATIESDSKDFTILFKSSENIDVSFGSVIVSKKDASTLTVAYASFEGGSKDYMVGEPIQITGTTSSNTVTVESGVVADIIIDNLNISSGRGNPFYVKSGANVTLTLKNTNSFTTSDAEAAALRVPDGAVLTIDGDGTLTADSTNGSGFGAGIGGDSDSIGESGGKILILGGTVTAISDTGAGIGGGAGQYKNGVAGNGGSITISGGNVTATSSKGAGIGGGSSGYHLCGSGGIINITGGNVTATSEYGAGIGGGGTGDRSYQKGTTGEGGIITISGGTVTASSTNIYGGAGIGSGGTKYGTGNIGGTVTITGGTVKATTAATNGEAIGKGYKGTSSGTLQDGYGNPVTLYTFTLSGATADTPVTKIEGIKYGINDVKTLDTDKLYFYLPADSVASSITAGGNKYICNIGLTYYTAHDWSNKDGICANGCGYECPHESYTDSVCDTCGYVCPHDSYTDGVCDGCSYECPHEWGEGVLTRPVHDTVLGSKDGYYTYTCTVCDYEKKETVKGADYSAYDAVSEKINTFLESDELTDAAKQEIYSAANECGLLSDELMESEQNIVDDLVAELEKIVADAEEKIASGEYVKVDGFAVYNERGRQWLLKFNDDGVYEKANEIIRNLTDEANAKMEEMYAFALSLEGSVAENAENIAKLEADIDEFFGQIENCIRGVHNGFVYEVTEEAKCEMNAIESATCTLCGETDEREVEGSALEHSFTKYEETEAPKCGVAGKEVAYCDNGCQTTDERETPALEHIFLDYVSNGDATCTADGTKTAECINGCGATDTVADEGTMLDHIDEDGDKLCDDCHDEIKDVCPDCGRAVHEENGIAQYICAIIMFVKLVVSFVKMLQGAAA